VTQLLAFIAASPASTSMAEVQRRAESLARKLDADSAAASAAASDEAFGESGMYPPDRSTSGEALEEAVEAGTEAVEDVSGGVAVEGAARAVVESMEAMGAVEELIDEKAGMPTH